MITNKQAFYTFSAPNSGLASVKVLRGVSAPKQVGGYAKWEVNDRPKRVGSTRYVGSDPIRVDVSVLFDGWKDSNSIEDDITALNKMRQEVGDEPPVVRVNDTLGGGVPIVGIDWVIEDVDWDDNQIWDVISGTLVRLRQGATIHLLQVVEASSLAVSSRLPGNTRGSSSGTKAPAPYVVRQGDTLAKIALARYKDRSKWKDIAKRNDIKNPTSIKVGQKLILP